MAKSKLKIQVQKMRKDGASLKEIADKLNLAKSTVSSWCREIDLTDEQRQNLFSKMIKGGHAGRLLWAQANREKKQVTIDIANKEMSEMVGLIEERDRFISGISLYWAEGSKADSTSGFMFVNSDPVMIVFMYLWLIDFMNIKRKDIYVHISINEAHRSREEVVLNFWSNLLDLPMNQFNKTFFMKAVRQKICTNHNEYYGVCRLGVRRSSWLKYRMLALIDIIKAGVAQVVRASAS